MGRHFNYAPGDQVRDLTFEPAVRGVITRKGEKPDTYYVRLDGKTADVVIHARNLRMGGV